MSEVNAEAVQYDGPPMQYDGPPMQYDGPPIYGYGINDYRENDAGVTTCDRQLRAIFTLHADSTLEYIDRSPHRVRPRNRTQMRQWEARRDNSEPANIATSGTLKKETGA